MKPVIAAPRFHGAAAPVGEPESGKGAKNTGFPPARERPRAVKNGSVSLPV